MDPNKSLDGVGDDGTKKDSMEAGATSAADRNLPQNAPSTPPDNGCEGILNQKIKESAKRNDHGRLHAVQNSVLSRGLLEALRRNGQSIRPMREMEREFRNALRPKGPFGKFYFDRFWACTLRLILAHRLEEKELNQETSEPHGESPATELYREIAPMLITVSAENSPALRMGAPGFNTDLLQRLTLIARYDRAAAREQYRCLSILLLLRDQADDSGLMDWAAAMVGIKPHFKKEDPGWAIKN